MSFGSPHKPYQFAYSCNKCGIPTNGKQKEVIDKKNKMVFVEYHCHKCMAIVHRTSKKITGPIEVDFKPNHVRPFEEVLTGKTTEPTEQSPPKKERRGRQKGAKNKKKKKT